MVMRKTHANENKKVGVLTRDVGLVRASKNAKSQTLLLKSGFEYGSPTWARTRDTRINSPMLYQLSYWGIEAYSTDLPPTGQHSLH